MPEKISMPWPEMDAYPDRRQLVENYIGGFSERDLAASGSIADQIYNPTRSLARHQVLIPVAAHQEALQIENALHQYANQQTDEPFSVILSLNSPTSEQNNPGIDDTLAQIEKSKQAHPHLGLRTAMTFYDQPTIGMIRRDLWNGALLASTYSGTYDSPDDDIIGINHDIDVVSISPRYIGRIQTHHHNTKARFERNGLTKSPFSPRSTIIRHAPSPGHPNISKGALWADFTARQQGLSYEAGLVIPFSHYAHAGGFQVDATTYETGPLRHKVALKSIAGTNMQTSPRRYIERLQYGYGNIWSNETFGANDTCRTVTNQSDIPHEQLEELIEADDGLRETLKNIGLLAIDRFLKVEYSKHPIMSIADTDDQDDIIQSLNALGDRRRARQLAPNIFDKKMRLVTAVLERAIESPRLANISQSLQHDEDFRKSVLRQFDY